MSGSPGPHTTLQHYPWIVVRFACTSCRAYSNVRLAVLAERFGATQTIGVLVEMFQRNCPHRSRKRNGRISHTYIQCGGYCPDLGTTRPPDLPPSLSGLILIHGGRDNMLPAKPRRVERRRRMGGDDE